MTFQSADYRRVINSSRWRDLRRRLLFARGFRCERCGAEFAPSVQTPLQLHHLTYERLGHELDSDLVLVCPSCHLEADVERAREGQHRSAEALYDAQFEGWIRARYGDNYDDLYDDNMYAALDRWRDEIQE